MSLDNFVEILGSIFGRSGGRSATQPNMESPDEVRKDHPWYMEPPKVGESKLTIVQITDVYTLENFPSLKTMLSEIRRAQGPNGKVVSMLTGDFLSPYLLSSIDRGAGMMAALKATPVDILTWGNHEADIDHRTTCKHVRKWPGIWINSNMQSHDMMKYQVPYHIIEIPSPDGSQTRKVGLIAVLSNEPNLYAHFKGGAFGGAKIEDPWDTLRYYETELKEEHGCDLVIPLEHLYIPENTKTCEQFDFPVVLSGHDHHRVDKTIYGTRLIKPGMDGVCAAVLEVSWADGQTFNDKPRIRNAFVDVSNFEPDPDLRKQTKAAYKVLAPLRNTELAKVPQKYFPLSSKNARGELCTMGRLICTILKTSIEQTREVGVSKVDAVILMGGNIRGGEVGWKFQNIPFFAKTQAQLNVVFHLLLQDYPDGSFFSLEMLEAEIKSDEVLGVVYLPGAVLTEGIEATHQGDPKPGWMQFDDGIKMDPETKTVVEIAGAPVNPSRLYRVATKISDLTNGESPPLKNYVLANPQVLPSKGDYINIQTELMGFFARNLFRRLWNATGKYLSSDDLSKLHDTTRSRSEAAELEGKLRLTVLDRDGDGKLSVEDIHIGLRDYLGLSVHEKEMTLAKCIHDYADRTGDGTVTVDDFEIFCTGDGFGKSSDQAFPQPIEKLYEEEADESPSKKDQNTDHDDEEEEGYSFFVGS